MANGVAIVLAAGKGTRMKSDTAKVMLPVCGRPMIHFVIEALQKSGIEKQIVVVGFQANQVQEALQTQAGNIEFVLQTEQLGTGHAVQMCKPHLTDHDGPVVVVAGDSPLLQPDSLRQLLDHFQKTRPGLLLGTLLKDDPAGLGRIVRDHQGNFLAIVEEKDANQQQRKITEVNMSTYVFDGRQLTETLDQLQNNNAQGEYYLTDMVTLLRQADCSVEALPVLQPCEALSINNPLELQIVDAKMREMKYPCD